MGGSLRLEALLFSFPSPYWNVRTLSPIVKAMASFMQAHQAEIAKRRPVRLQLIRHDLCRANALIPQQFTHEFERSPFVPAPLHQNVEDFALPINRSPQVHLLAADIHKNLIQMPDIERGVTAPTNSATVFHSKFQGPAADRLITDVNPSLSQQILNIPVPHGEAEMKPNGPLDNVGMKTVTAIRYFLHHSQLPQGTTKVNVTSPWWHIGRNHGAPGTAAPAG